MNFTKDVGDAIGEESNRQRESIFIVRSYKEFK